MAVLRMSVGFIAIALFCTFSAAHAQDTTDFDFNRLAFRGFGIDLGYVYPTRTERAVSYGGRFDMGYARPGLRVVPRVSYWSAPLLVDEVAEFEDRIVALVEGQTGDPLPQLNLGPINWQDVAFGVDTHVVWDTPFDLLTYGGLGVTVHALKGYGDAIQGTFIDELLNTVTAGFNLHFGAEYPFTSSFRAYGVAKYEVLSDLQLFNLSVGWQIMTGPSAPGEER